MVNETADVTAIALTVAGSLFGVGLAAWLALGFRLERQSARVRRAAARTRRDAGHGTSRR